MVVVFQTSLIHGFQNGTTPSQGRKFHGMAAPHPALVRFVDPRSAEHISVAAGDTLAFTGLDADSQPHIVAFDATLWCRSFTLMGSISGYFNFGCYQCSLPGANESGEKKDKEKEKEAQRGKDGKTRHTRASVDLSDETNTSEAR